MTIREVKKNTRQYVDFVNHRLPAMQRNGLDGLAIKVSDRRGPTCCFDTDNRFRIDLEEHVIRDHLNYFTLELFKNLTIYPCNICQTTTRITCTKSTTRSYYTIIRKCGCKPAKPHRFTQPWSTLTFIEMCNELRRYNHSLKRKVFVQNPTTSPYQSIAVQIDVIGKPLKYGLDLQSPSYQPRTPSSHTIATQTDVVDKPSKHVSDSQNPCYKPRTPPNHSIATQTDFIHKSSEHESDFPKISYNHSSQLTIFDLKSPPHVTSDHNELNIYAQNQSSHKSRLHPVTLLAMKKYQTKRNMNIIDDHKSHNKSKNYADRHRQQAPKSCCSVS